MVEEPFMSTRKQRAASRANGQKSQGPITPAGKANSRYNALKHGIDAKQQIMFHESAEDLAELAAEYHEFYSPANVDERFLVDTLVNNEWRLRRLRCVEADLWRAANNLFIENHPEIGESAPGDAFESSGPAFDRLQRIMNSCQRQYHHARKELQALNAARPRHQNTPQPQEATTTSAFPGSFYTNPENAASAAPKTAPQPQATPAEAAHTSQPSVDEQFGKQIEAIGLHCQGNFGQ
jgi:hypothetical protein